LKVTFYKEGITTTTNVGLIIGNGMFKEKAGYEHFEKDMPCNFTLYTSNTTAPKIEFGAAYSTLNANTTLQFDCQKNATDKELYEVANLQLDIQAHFSLSVAENVTAYLEVEELSLGLAPTVSKDQSGLHYNPWSPCNEDI
jgi:hypothetical protein